MAKQTFNLSNVQSQKVSNPANWEIVADEKKVTVIHKRGGHTIDFKKSFAKCEGVLTLVGTGNKSYAYVRTQGFQNTLNEFCLTGVLSLDQIPNSIENYEFGNRYCKQTAYNVSLENTFSEENFKSEYYSNSIRSSILKIDEKTKWVVIKTQQEDKDIKRYSKYLYLKKGVKIEDVIEELRQASI